MKFALTGLSLDHYPHSRTCGRASILLDYLLALTDISSNARYAVSSEFSATGKGDMGNAGPFRGELGEATEGSIRTFCFIHWPGHVKPNTTSYAMFSIMDFLPTFASILGAKLPGDRPIDGLDQTAVLLGNSETGFRESLLSFVGPELVALRWKQWRIYFKDMKLAGTGQCKCSAGFLLTAQICPIQRSTISKWIPTRI